MGKNFHGWRRKVGPLTLLLALAPRHGWIESGVTNASHVGGPTQRSLPEDVTAENIQADYQDSDEANEVPKVAVHVWMIDVVTSSPDSDVILKDFGIGLDSALVKFNSPSNTQPGNFATSDILAALLKEFRRKAKIIVHDESPRIISSGQTDNWGDAISISVTPTVKSGNEIRVYVSADFGRPPRTGSPEQRSQSSMDIQSGQTSNFSGMTNCSTETKAIQIPVLGQNPFIGNWFTFPYTRTRGNSKLFFLSATIIPGSDALSEPK